MNDCAIRKYSPLDRPEVRRIAWDTAFAGKPASAFFKDEPLLCDALTRYFTDYEPGSCFVAQGLGRVVAYLIGAVDTRRMERVFRRKVLPGFLWRAIARPLVFSRMNRRLLSRFFVSWVRGELRTPDFSREYPATLHINCRETFRGQGVGKRLMDAYLEYLCSRRVKGVWLSTASESAKGFFEKQGFSILYTGRRSYWKHLLGHDIQVYSMGRRIS